MTFGQVVGGAVVTIGTGILAVLILAAVLPTPKLMSEHHEWYIPWIFGLTVAMGAVPAIGWGLLAIGAIKP